MPSPRDAISWITTPRRRKTISNLHNTNPNTTDPSTGSPLPRAKRKGLGVSPARPTLAERAVSVPATTHLNSTTISAEESPTLPFTKGTALTDSGYFGAETIPSLTDRLAARSEDAAAGGIPAHLERIQQLLEVMAMERKSDLKDAVDRNSRMLKNLLEAGEENVKRERRRSSALDLSPLNEYLGLIHTAIERLTGNMEALMSWGDKGGQRVLIEELRRLAGVVDEGNRQAVIGRAAPVVDIGRLERGVEGLREVNEGNARELREVMLSLKEGSGGGGGAKLDEVNEHLRSLREWSEYDSEHLKQLLHLQRDKQAGASNVHQRMDRMDAQMRDLMAGQREMVDVMRQLAESITASTKGQCDHIIVPPPRKMGRKIVGFVYDAKEC